MSRGIFVCNIQRAAFISRKLFGLIAANYAGSSL
jgi:hypothetical protein